MHFSYLMTLTVGLLLPMNIMQHQTATNKNLENTTCFLVLLESFVDILPQVIKGGPRGKLAHRMQNKTLKKNITKFKN